MSFTHMRSLATLSMVTKKGHTSTWYFAQFENGKYYAHGGCHRPLVKEFTSILELRSLYRSYLSYGYKLVGKADEAFTRTVQISDPWESELPVELQMELAALSA